MMRIHTTRCAIVAALMFLTSVSAASPTSVIPIDYRYGPIPVPYQPFNYTAYPYTLGSIPDITDGSLATFTRVQGLDNILQSNGTFVDTGTFYLLQFQLDPHAQSFRIDFTAKVQDDYPASPFGDFQILGLSPDGVTAREVEWMIAARQPTTFGIDFLRDSNTGTHPAGVGWGLNSMINPDGKLRVVLNGMFGATVNKPGRVTTEFYDLTASYTVPEPALAPIICLCAAILRNRRRHRTRCS